MNKTMREFIRSALRTDHANQIKRKIDTTTGTSLTTTGLIKSSSPAAGIGYAVGAGGTVTQLTSKSTGVEINKMSGQITMHNANLLATTSVSFIVTNSACAVTDAPIVAITSGGTVGSYIAAIDAVGSGSFTVTLYNIGSIMLGEAVVLNFAIIKGVSS